MNDIGAWVIMIYLCNPNLSAECSYHLFGPGYLSYQACFSDLKKLRSRYFQKKECKQLEAPGLIFTPPG
jgi:hypothetical protein